MVKKHRYGVKNAMALRDTRGLADNGRIIDDVHQRHAVEDDVECAGGIGQPGSVSDLEGDQRRTGASPDNHGVRIINARVTDAAGEQRGKYIRVIATAAADIEDARVRDARRGDGFRRDLEVEARLAVRHGCKPVLIGVTLPPYIELREPATGRSGHFARFV